jgi:Tol biopolymer transport system component
VLKTVLIAFVALVLVAAAQAGAGSSLKSFQYPNWMPDGTLVYQAHEPWPEIQRVTLDGESSTLFAGTEGLARVSVRGELAFISATAQTSLTVRDASGRSRVLARARPLSRGVSWSPDGRAIAFQTVRGHLATIGADGTGLHEFPFAGNDPVWSPDGTRIAFSRAAKTAVVDVKSGVAHTVGPTLVSADGRHGEFVYPTAAWSPNSARLAIQLSDGVHIVRSDGSGIAALIKGAYSPSWSPDGSELALIRGDDIVVATAAGSSERVLVASAMEETTPTWSPDGRWIAYTNRNATPPGQAYQQGHAADVFVIHPEGTGRRSLTGGCGVGPETPLTWLCVVNGSWAVPLTDVPSPTVTITPLHYPRAVRIPIHVTDGSRYVYGARVTVRQLSGLHVRITSTFGKPPSLLSDTGGRAAFRFLKPRKHGKLTFRVVAAGQARLLTLRV